MPIPKEWRDPRTIVAAIIAVSIGEALWFGAGGVIDLKSWQTLLAAFVALGAALLAYQGAMAKVNYDRDVVELERVSRKLNIRQRLRWELNGYLSLLEIMGAHASNGADDLYIEVVSRLRFEDSKDINTAWENVELLTGSEISGLAGVRHCFQELVHRAADLATQKESDQVAGIRELNAAFVAFTEKKVRKLIDRLSVGVAWATQVRSAEEAWIDKFLPEESRTD
jgi:hypothetical protein